MSSQLYVSGPPLIYVGTGSSGAFQFFGWARDEVRISLEGSFEDYNADVAGGTPYDVGYMAEGATISFDAFRYSEALFQILAARTASAASVAAAAAAGTVPAPGAGAGVGTLMVSEGAAIPLLIVSPYATSKPAFSGMVPGYNFSKAWLTNNVDVNLNTRPKNPRMVFRAIPAWNPVTGAGVLYTNVVPGGLPSPA